MQAIENYLIENNAGKAIAESKSAKGLTDKTRRTLINHLANYAIRIFGMGISPEQAIMFSKSAIIAIPSLGINGGIVSLYFNRRILLLF